MTQGTLTFDDTFVYSTTAAVDGSRPRGVTVVFFATSAPSGLELGDQLKEHFKRVAEAEELWLVAPRHLDAELVALVGSRDLQDRLLKATALSAIRSVLFDESGRWVQSAARGDSDLDIDKAQPGVQRAGLRALFAACGGLLSAHAGLHFGKPSGKHAAHFLRGGAVAERSVHAHFMATSLLEWASAHDYERLWVDTAAISSVAYALNNLRSALSGSAPAVVDSFGGHGGLDAASFSQPGLALISATTSGGLSQKLVARTVSRERQRTLFYVGESKADSTVLCDLTARDNDDAADLIQPFKTWDNADSCELCKNGQNVVVLHGDSFSPSPGYASSLQLVGALSDSDHRSFVRVCLGKRVIALRETDGKRTPTVRSVSLHFRHLIENDDAIRDLFSVKLSGFLPFRTRYLVHLDDPESLAIAELAKDLCGRRGMNDVELIPASNLNSRTSLSEGVSVVIAGLVASGRELLNISRELRKLVVGGGDLAYFIGCMRPSGQHALRDLRINLTYKADKTKYPFESVWYAQMEPYDPGTDPWTAEGRMLSALEAWLEETHPQDARTLAALSVRLDALTRRLDHLDGFVASDFGADAPRIALTLNPNFALWDFDLPAATATHAEVYFTVSTVLHRSRYSSDGRYSLFEQPGYGHVLAPTNFDRFNDPVIQAALLRGARGTELRFAELPEQSSRMAEVIATSVSEWADQERGGAALEFALSLLRGVKDDTSGAIRLSPKDYEIVWSAAQTVDAELAPVLARALQFVEFSRLSM